MHDPARQVRPAVHSKMDVSARLVAGWARVIARIGKGVFADAMGVDVKTVSRAMSGETLPELHTVINSLRADPTALNEVFAAAGFELRPVGLCAANDMATISDLSRLTTQWVEALADGVRDHRETLALADSIRPLVQALNAIVGEADRHRGVAA